MDYFMRALKIFINKKSLRSQILITAALMAIVVLAFTWAVGRWVESTGYSSTQNMEHRLELTELSHDIRRTLVEANIISMHFYFPLRLKAAQVFTNRYVTRVNSFEILLRKVRPCTMTCRNVLNP